MGREAGAIQALQEGLPEGTPIALETIGERCWIADKIEAAGRLTSLTHAPKANVTMGSVNHIDKLNAKRLAERLHVDSLPTVLLPSWETRDE